MLARAVAAISQGIEESWKRDNLLNFDLATSLVAVVPLGGLGDWIEVRSRLAAIAVVMGVEPIAISRRSARIDLSYLGDETRLSAALQAAGPRPRPRAARLGAAPRRGACRHHGARRVNAPNAISLARLLSVPVALWLITTGAYGAAFWLFVAAGVSDGVDGYLAKRLGQRTELGRYLDPLADKVLLVSVYVVLGIQDELPSWLVILVVARDMLIVGCSALALMMSQSVKIQPLLISKLNTFTQIVLAALTLAMLGLGIGDRLLIDALIYAVATTTLLSGGSYLFKWARQTATLEDTT